MGFVGSSRWKSRKFSEISTLASILNLENSFNKIVSIGMSYFFSPQIILRKWTFRWDQAWKCFKRLRKLMLLRLIKWSDLKAMLLQFVVSLSSVYFSRGECQKHLSSVWQISKGFKDFRLRRVIYNYKETWW